MTVRLAVVDHLIAIDILELYIADPGALAGVDGQCPVGSLDGVAGDILIILEEVPGRYSR